MAKPKRNRRARVVKATLEYPHHVFKPVEVTNFIQMKGFSEEWDHFGLDDEDLRLLEMAIMASPSAHPVIRGTGGLRKVRFSPDGWPTGKSGALRVGFMHFPEFQIVVQVIVYKKDEMDNISHGGRKIIKKLIEKLHEEFSKGSVR